jgi:hypothetical protein
VYLHRSQKKTENGPSICATKKRITNREWSFCMRIRVSGHKKHLFYKTNTQMLHYKVIPLQQPFAPSFVYLRIHILGQRNHSLKTQQKNVFGGGQNQTFPTSFFLLGNTIENIVPILFLFLGNYPLAQFPYFLGKTVQ